VRVRTGVWANKEIKDVPQAWRETATTYINTDLVTMKTKSSSRGIEWHLNRWHFGLIVAYWACDALTQTPFLDDENRKQKTRDLRHLTFQVSVISFKIENLRKLLINFLARCIVWKPEFCTLYSWPLLGNPINTR
jgi:hypothetical protein